VDLREYQLPIYPACTEDRLTMNKMKLTQIDMALVQGSHGRNKAQLQRSVQSTKFSHFSDGVKHFRLYTAERSPGRPPRPTANCTDHRKSTPVHCTDHTDPSLPCNTNHWPFLTRSTDHSPARTLQRSSKGHATRNKQHRR
jgi:hypothetical protein